MHKLPDFAQSGDHATVKMHLLHFEHILQFKNLGTQHVARMDMEFLCK